MSEQKGLCWAWSTIKYVLFDFPRLLFLLVLFLSPDTETQTLVLSWEADLEAQSAEVKHSFSLTRKSPRSFSTMLTETLLVWRFNQLLILTRMVPGFPDLFVHVIFTYRTKTCRAPSVCSHCWWFQVHRNLKPSQEGGGQTDNPFQNVDFSTVCDPGPPWAHEPTV